MLDIVNSLDSMSHSKWSIKSLLNSAPPQTNFHICCLVARNVTTKEGLLSFNNLGDTSAPPPVVDVYCASVLMTVLFDALCPFHLSSVYFLWLSSASASKDTFRLVNSF